VYRNIFETILEACDKAEELVPYPTSESALEVCWKTLTANHHHSGMSDKEVWKTPPDGPPAFMSFLSRNMEGNGPRFIKAEAAGPGKQMRSTSWITEIRDVDPDFTPKRAPGSDIFVTGAGVHRRIFWTKRGYLGLARNGIRDGDSVCLFPGAKVPFIIRGPVARHRQGGGWREFYHIVCEAYIHGIMKGEARYFNDVKTYTFDRMFFL
jgi:hypothetical protein